MGFDQLNLTTPLRNAIDDLGLKEPTEIQRQALPVIMSGKDVVGIAQTGSGKTFGYLLPILRMLKFSKQRDPRVLILVPTRELVLQVEGALEALSTYMNLRFLGIYGGANINKQKAAVADGLDILISTPGRIIDLGMSGALKLKSVQKVVLDEVDEMLALGFRSQLEQIFDLLPRNKQGILFSATMTSEVEKIIDEHFIVPQRVEIEGSGSIMDSIDVSKYEVENFYTKINLLEILLQQEEYTRVLVFVKFKRYADLLFETLSKDIRGEENTSEFALIHSNKTQNYRLRSIKRFQEGKHRILIATDLVARGLDFENISHVINFDIPESTEAFLHRIGRTARAGKDGNAICLVSDREKDAMTQIEKDLDHAIPLIQNPENLSIDSRLIDEEVEKEIYKPLVKKRSDEHKPGPAFHEKKDKNKKVNLGNSHKLKKKNKYKKPKTRGQKRR